MGLKILRPPKISVDSRKAFWKQIVMIIIGTTISLLLTIMAAQLVEQRQRAKDRRLSAMMVMSGIKEYEQGLEYLYELLGRTDTVAQWLLSRPVEELDQMPEEELLPLVEEALNLYSLTYDNTTYNIFSNGIETWKNMRNYQFVTNVGMCYTSMQSTADKWNHWGAEIDNLTNQIKTHPDEYPGKNLPSKYLRNLEIRMALESVHEHRNWLLYRAKALNYDNSVNMSLMKVTEEDVLEYIEKSQEALDIEYEYPSMDDNTPALNADNLTTMSALDARIDSIMQNK